MLTDICRTPILFPLVSWLQPATHESCAIDIDIWRFTYIVIYIYTVYGSLHTAVTTQIA